MTDRYIVTYIDGVRKRGDYNGSYGVNSGGVGDAAIGNDVVQEGLDELPFQKEVLLQDPLLGVVLVVVYVVRCHSQIQLLFRRARHSVHRDSERQTARRLETRKKDSTRVRE